MICGRPPTSYGDGDDSELTSPVAQRDFSGAEAELARCNRGFSADVGVDLRPRSQSHLWHASGSGFCSGAEL